MEGSNINNSLGLEPKQKVFKEIYKSAIRASYFMGAKGNDLRKSQIQRQSIVEDIEQDKTIDQKTFRMMKGFKRPDDTFKVNQKKGNVYFQFGGFLCFGRGKKKYEGEVNNSKFSIKSGQKILRYVDFNAVSAKVFQKGNRVIINFEGLPDESCIEFSADDKSWNQLLYKVIKQTDGANKHRTFLARKWPQFYKQEHIFNSEFEKMANTGDVMLFRSSHTAAKAQRALTNSQYGKKDVNLDHVGVILRNSKNQLFVYESDSYDGVGMTPWKSMIKYEWYQEIEKIAWRPLNIQLANYEVEVIEAYVAKTLGKGFELNLNKLFMFTSKLERSKEQDQKQTYFCSELVARLYKELKLIDGSKSSASYYPIDFSNKGSIKFIRQGVNLGNEKIIAFGKP